jgi:hypothetical protein
MRMKLQFAGCVLVLLGSAATALPSAAQHPHYAAQQQPAARPSAPASHPQRQAPRQQQRQQQRQQAQQNTRPQGRPNGAGNPSNGASRGGQSNPDWNRPGGGAVRPDRPPSANTPPRSYNNLSQQDKQRVLDNNRKLQNLSPAQRQELNDRAHVWDGLSQQQRDHIRNDLLPRWKQMPPDRKRAIQQRLGVLKNMPESARNQHLNDPNFTRGMSEEDKSTLRDLSHLHVGGAPDTPNE